jgi:hypothetical protein
VVSPCRRLAEAAFLEEQPSSETAEEIQKHLNLDCLHDLQFEPDTRFGRFTCVAGDLGTICLEGEDGWWFSLLKNSSKREEPRQLPRCVRTTVSKFEEVGFAPSSRHCSTIFHSAATASESSASTVGVCGHTLEIWATLACLRASRDITMDVTVALLMFEEGSTPVLGFRG